MTRRGLTLVLLAAVGGAGLTCGCGGDSDGRVAISGRVSFRGTPLKNGTIELVSKDRASQSGAPITDGQYSIPSPKSLRPGEYTVRISSVQVEGPAPSGPPGPEAMTQKTTELIPAEYNSNSSLTAVIPEGGTNKLDFNLK